MLIPFAGGNLTSNDTNQSILIQVPAGAVLTDTVITYTHKSPLPSGELSDIGHFFDLTVSQTDKLFLGFNKPVTIEVQYTEQEIGSVISSSLNLYWLSGTTWITNGITSTIRTDTSLTSITDHFTLFALLGMANRIYLPIILK